MQVTETLSDGLKRAWSIIVPAADIDARREKRLAEITRTANIPGFRPGKVPVAVIKKRFGSAVMAEVLARVIQTPPASTAAPTRARPKPRT